MERHATDIVYVCVSRPISEDPSFSDRLLKFV